MAGKSDLDLRAGSVMWSFFFFNPLLEDFSNNSVLVFPKRAVAETFKTDFKYHTFWLFRTILVHTVAH